MIQCNMESIPGRALAEKPLSSHHSRGCPSIPLPPPAAAFTNVLNQEKSRLQAQKAGWETSAGEDLESSLAEVSSLLQKFLAAQAEGYVSRDAEVAVPILLEAEKAGNVMQSELSKLESELKVARSVSRSVKKRGAAGGGEGRAGGGGSAAGKNAEGRGTAASLLGGNGADDYAAGAGAGSAASGSSEAVLAAAGDWGAFPGQEEQEEGERSSSSSSKGRSRAGGASRASAGRAAAAGGGRSRVKAGEDEEEDDSRMQLESSQLSALDASGNGSPLEESGPVSTGRGHKAGDAFTFNF